MTKAELIKKNEALTLEILELKQQLQDLQRMVFGRKSERFIPVADGQLNIFGKEEEQQQQEAPPGEIVIESHTRKKSNHKGRSLIAGLSHLPVTEVEIEVAHAEDSECIGQVERSTLGYHPGRFFIQKEIIKKYKDPESGKISPATFPAQPIPRCEAHITLLVYICVAKFVDHLPEYRQQQMFKRDRVVIPPSTMNGWVHGVANLMKPMANWIGGKIMDSGYILVDESTIKVMEGKKNRTHTGWMWVIYSPALRCVQFIYHKGRTQDIPITLLKDYVGKFQTDGLDGYEVADESYKNIDHSNCNAHARRYFEKALSNDRPRAEFAMKVYQQMYEVEKENRTYLEDNQHISLEAYYRYREEQRKELLPLMDEYKLWLENAALEVLPSSAIGKAITYVQKRWDKLTKYITDGELEIDNNLIENAIRPLALGRKNFLFAGNHEAAQNIAVFQTIFGTCKHMGINPTEYLTWYLENIAATNINEIEKLSPWSFKENLKN